VPAIGPGGEYNGKTYGDYEELAQRFLKAMLHVWHKGDQYGHLFAFPKCDLHITEETFSDPRQLELLEYACNIASDNGVPYFIFDRDEVTLSACCRLRTTIDDTYMISHPESMRFCGFQNVTVNLPQAAFRTNGGSFEDLCKEIDKGIDIAVKAHLQKRQFISKLMSEPHMPLWEIAKEAMDGRPYVDLDAATYIVGLVGLNECVQHMTGQELHESDEAFKYGLRVISYMYFRAKDEAKKLGIKITLEESPAESATRRMAKVDMRRFPEQARRVIKGDVENDQYYYTNSIHMRADAPVDMLERVMKQSKFHQMIESGAIIHAFVGEERPPAESIKNLVAKTFEKSQCAQLTISPEFTVCRSCNKMIGKLVDTCSYCESEDVYGVTRIVGYYSRVNNWNKSKLGELKDRQAGNYSVAGAREAVTV